MSLPYDDTVEEVSTNENNYRKIRSRKWNQTLLKYTFQEGILSNNFFKFLNIPPTVF